MENALYCQVCSKPAKLRCSACKEANYCTVSHQTLMWKFHKTDCTKDINDYYLPDLTRKEVDLYCRTRELSFKVNFAHATPLNEGDFFIIPPLIMEELHVLVAEQDTLGTLEEALKKKLPYRNPLEYLWQSLYLDHLPLKDKNKAIAAVQFHLRAGLGSQVDAKHSTQCDDNSTICFPSFILFNFITAFENSNFPEEVVNVIFRELLLWKAIFDLPTEGLNGLQPQQKFEYLSEVYHRLDALVNILWFSPCQSDGEILIELSVFLAAYVQRKDIAGFNHIGNTGEVYTINKVKTIATQRFEETWPKDLNTREE